MEFTNKIILITGATGGLGREMVSQFSLRGAKLILTDLKEESLQSLQKNFNSSVIGRMAIDLSTGEGCELLYKKVSEEFGTPDILINNAGIATLGRFSETPGEKWESVLNINLFAPMRITHKFLKDMLSRKNGYLVNISSVAGLVASAGLAAYSTSKFGIRAFGEAIHHEYHAMGIGVTNLYPFFTDTPILRSEQYGFKENKIIPDFLLSQPDEVIRALLDGIENRKLHVYPGLISRTMEFLSRTFPGLVESLSERQMD